MNPPITVLGNRVLLKPHFYQGKIQLDPRSQPEIRGLEVIALGAGGDKINPEIQPGKFVATAPMGSLRIKDPETGTEYRVFAAEDIVAIVPAPPEEPSKLITA